MYSCWICFVIRINHAATKGLCSHIFLCWYYTWLLNVLTFSSKYYSMQMLKRFQNKFLILLYQWTILQASCIARCNEERPMHTFYVHINLKTKLFVDSKSGKKIRFLRWIQQTLLRMKNSTEEEANKAQSW